jgi:hypothetical protein
MKRIKMMLLSLGLFAVVGGALAFKARFQTNYCVTNTSAACDTQTGLKCPNLFSKSKPDNNGTAAYCTTTVPSGGCVSTTPCTTDASISLIKD